MATEKNKVEVLFKYDSPILEEAIIEVLWAEVVDEEKGLYQLKSIPFYGASIATDDQFYATYDKEETGLLYRQTTKSSGNSIAVVAIINEEYDQEEMVTAFEKLGCTVEELNDRYFAMEVPKRVFYGDMKTIFNKYEKDNLEYAETYLSAKHQADLRRGGK
ncbi:DUF4265 domain-containing protein [Lewinella cohaerens]|uniref:DUF4265 domain-containing protein n=1 Tax=Lewinella cohaerens TaxID=70995 RepID=UPI000376207C|nr:DUF4265 domain-containing protein [Lewinella cohaerens]